MLLFTSDKNYKVFLEEDGDDLWITVTNGYCVSYDCIVGSVSEGYDPEVCIQTASVFFYPAQYISDNLNANDDRYGWTITSPSDDLLEFILKNDLTDILINRNEFSGFQITGTGTHNGVPTFVGVAPRKSSSRKYACPCCGMSVRAKKAVNIACMDCDEQLLLVG